MLLTITTTRQPATDLGFLLHKHPERVQSFPLPFGQAHVFYPEATDERCTAALLLDVDPVGLIRRGVRVSAARPVRERPAVCRVLVHERCDRPCVQHGPGGQVQGAAGACRRSRCRLRRDSRRCRVAGGEDVLRRLFEPLGYAVDATAASARRAVSRVGREPLLHGRARRPSAAAASCSPTCTCSSRARRTRSTTGSARTRSRSCCAAARAGLPAHPERELIVSRYLKHQRSLRDEALAQLLEDEDPSPDGDRQAARGGGRGRRGADPAERAAARRGRRRAEGRAAPSGSSTSAAAAASCCGAC